MKTSQINKSQSSNNDSSNNLALILVLSIVFGSIACCICLLYCLWKSRTQDQYSEPGETEVNDESIDTETVELT